ncbi:MAG: glycoside hydrolase family 3 N-terminal domain-containing protein, partial [Acholeplasmataceae bacterium]|nr:glycoside hydrolase family 3 N-terminal domain-containing protein [Acholeplasmataceae bacterium]
IAAKEAASSGIHVTFSPMVDVTRDIRWGRVTEGYGEDAYLTGEMGYELVKGYQGDFSNENVAACLKHFAGYGAPDAGRDYNEVTLSKETFFNYYMPAYAKTLEANPQLVMTSFNTLFGIPATANKYLLRDILRGQYKFNGVIISDFASTANMISHKYADSSLSAAIKSIKAGLDIDMMSDVYSKHLYHAAEKDPSILKLIDEATLNVLKIKEKLGLFKDPYRGLVEDNQSPQFYDDGTNLELAIESVVLLKNNNLPLKNEKVYLMGEYADSRRTNGSWSWVGGHISNNKTLKEIFPNQTSYEAADVIIYCFGEGERESGESQSKTNPSVKQKDVNQLKQLHEDGKKVIGVVYSGRPLILTEVETYLDSIVFAFYLGNQMSEAIKRLLLGEVNFSGRLPISIPLNVGQIPMYYGQFSTSRPRNTDDLTEQYVSNYKDSPNTPLYYFGDGLSYSEVKYHSLTLNKTTLSEGETVKLSVKLENLSNIFTKEVVQVYINDLFSEIVRPKMELVLFEKVSLNPKQTLVMELELKYESFMYKDGNNENKLEEGPIEIMIGSPRKIFLQETIEIL